MNACKMCWKTKEVSPVFMAYPRAVEFCKGCAFDIHRVVNALAYALDTSGFAIALVRRNLILLDVSKPGATFINLLTGELVDELSEGDPPAGSSDRVRIFEEVPREGEIEEGSPEGGLREGQDSPESLQTLVDDPSQVAKAFSRSKPNKSK